MVLLTQAPHRLPFLFFAEHRLDIVQKLALRIWLEGKHQADDDSVKIRPGKSRKIVRMKNQAQRANRSNADEPFYESGNPIDVSSRAPLRVRVEGWADRRVYCLENCRNCPDSS